MPLATPASLSLKARALQCLAQREHSRAELRRKLIDHAAKAATASPRAAPRHDAGDAVDEPAAPSFTRRAPASPELQAGVDALLDTLAAEGLLSEARFIETRVRARLQRHGNLRIRQELAQHGLALAPEDEAALKHSELARARQVWSRKFDAPATDAAGRARQLRFLAGRGFSADVIRRLLRGDDD